MGEYVEYKYKGEAGPGSYYLGTHNSNVGDVLRPGTIYRVLSQDAWQFNDNPVWERVKTPATSKEGKDK